MKFLFENSPIPIYQSIINSIIKTLVELKHEAISVNIAENSELLNKINNKNLDFVVITNFSGRLTSFVEKENKFIFEYLKSKIIFIHHDDIFCNGISANYNLARIRSFQSINHKSWHFCIEHNNYLSLRTLGIENSFPIHHASEFSEFNTHTPATQFDLSFVGHVLPPVDLNQIFNDPFVSHFLHQAYWSRVCQPSIKIEKIAQQCADSIIPNADADMSIAFKHLFINTLHSASQFFRGDVINRLSDFKLHIFGGDPSYLFGKSYNRKIQKKNLQYSKPVDRKISATIFKQSKINLNITSLQFDSTVINRVIDVAMLGGFILTDRKEGLKTLTSTWMDISYDSIDELNSKIEYFLSNDKARIEISKQLQQDIKQKCTYKIIVKEILSKLISDKENTPKSLQPLKLDIGCGPRKAEGFIGVDIDENWASVDVVADLTKKFPYPDNIVDEIRAHDIIEHLPDRIHTMNEFWRICKPNAIIDIRVPSTDGRGAFQDPTHISFWNKNSFLYYSVEAPAYIELSHSYGFKGAFKIENLSEEMTHEKLIHVHVILRVIK